MGSLSRAFRRISALLTGGKGKHDITKPDSKHAGSKKKPKRGRRRKKNRGQPLESRQKSKAPWRRFPDHQRMKRTGAVSAGQRRVQ